MAYRGPGNFQLLLFRRYHCPPRSQPVEMLGIPRTPERCWAHSGRLWSPLGTGCSPLQTVTTQYNPLPCRPSLPALFSLFPCGPRVITRHRVRPPASCLRVGACPGQEQNPARAVRARLPQAGCRLTGRGLPWSMQKYSHRLKRGHFIVGHGCWSPQLFFSSMLCNSPQLWQN